jgi:hypothetical protein
MATEKTKRRKPGRSISVAELARQQGVAPARNLQEIAELWPVDDDADALFQFILNERRERRQVRRNPSRG